MIHGFGEEGRLMNGGPEFQLDSRPATCQDMQPATGLQFEVLQEFGAA